LSLSLSHRLLSLSLSLSHCEKNSAFGESYPNGRITLFRNYFGTFGARWNAHICVIHACIWWFTHDRNVCASTLYMLKCRVTYWEARIEKWNDTSLSKVNLNKIYNSIMQQLIMKSSFVSIKRRSTLYIRVWDLLISNYSFIDTSLNSLCNDWYCCLYDPSTFIATFDMSIDHIRGICNIVEIQYSWSAISRTTSFSLESFRICDLFISKLRVHVLLS